MSHPIEELEVVHLLARPDGATIYARPAKPV